ncbi:RNI-like protein [Sparassis latifolia]
MSRRANQVIGPTSALTEFLRESGITATTVARRVRTRNTNQQQPAAGPSNTAQDEGGDADEGASAKENAEYDSDNLDEPNEAPAPKKRKLSKAAEAKLKAKEKAKEKAKAKAKGKKGGDDEDYEDDEDEDEDAYTALSKMWRSDLPKPPVGSFENCAKCKKQFTVTKYTMAANPPPGYLCHLCAKASGADPFKKPAAPRKRKAPAEKRNVVKFEENRIPSLAFMCIQLISEHINDVEALGDIGSINMDLIAKAISRNRSLTPQNAPLFYNIENKNLVLYDVTNLTPPAFCTMASLNPNLTNLRLDLCGRIDDSAIAAWTTSLPHLKRLELLGPFLVRVPAWQTFIKAHPALEGFLITQSPRFDLECMQALVESCPRLTELRLKEIGKMSDKFLEHIKALAGTLVSLDLSYPGTPDALSEPAVVDLLAAVGPSLTHLDLSGNIELGDALLFKGVKPHARQLTSFAFADVPELTDAGVAEFFDAWGTKTEDGTRPWLTVLDLAHNHQLAGDALKAVLNHSGATLVQMNINGWKAVSADALNAIAKHARDLRRLDVGFCREVDNWVVKELMDKCDHIEEVKVWGCQKLSEDCPRKRNVKIYGVEAHTIS